MRLLTKHGARVDDYDTFGMTPLLWAATLEHSDGATVRALIDAGAKPDAVSRTAKSGARRTPLSQAKKYNNTPVVETLQSALSRSTMETDR